MDAKKLKRYWSGLGVLVVLLLLHISIHSTQGALGDCADVATGPPSAQILLVMDEDLGVVDPRTGDYDELRYVHQLLNRTEKELKLQGMGVDPSARNMYSIVGFGKRSTNQQSCQTPAGCYANVYGFSADGDGDGVAAAASASTHVTIDNVQHLISQVRATAQTAANDIVDSYQAILEGLDALRYKSTSAAATFIILLTDQDRTHQYGNRGVQLTRRSIRRYLDCQNIGIAMVVDTFFHAAKDSRYSDVTAYYQELLGYDFATSALLVAEATGDFNATQVTGEVSFSSWGRVDEDYIALARLLRATVWDMNAVVRISSEQLRSGLKESSLAALSATVASTLKTQLANRNTAAECNTQLSQASRQCACEVNGGIASAETACNVEIDCVPTPWSSWSECLGQCIGGDDSIGVRTRHRGEATPRRLLGQDCHPLIEQKPCQILNCTIEGVSSGPTVMPSSTVHVSPDPTIIFRPTTSAGTADDADPAYLVVHIPNITSCDDSIIVIYTLLVYSRVSGTLWTRKSIPPLSLGQIASLELASVAGKTSGEYTAVVAGETADGTTCSLAEYTRSYPFQDVCLGAVVKGGTKYVQTHMHDPVAMDIVFVMENTRGKEQYHSWVSVYSKQLEANLTGMGIGSSADHPNLYSVVEFGGTTEPRLMKLNTSEEVLVRQGSIGNLVAQLQHEGGGHQLDGYSALSYAITNAPFRHAANTRSAIVFVTDEDRGVESYTGDIDTIVQELRRKDIALQVLVDTQFSINGEHDSDRPVFGNGDLGAYQYLPEERRAVFLPSANVASYLPFANVEQDYIQLAEKMDGMTWTILPLSYADDHMLVAIAEAVADSLHIHVSRTSNRCLQCVCSEQHGHATQDQQQDNQGPRFECLPDSNPERCVCEASDGQFKSTASAADKCRVTRDCVLSEWGNWGSCSVTCNNGTSLRKRSVQQQPTGHGARCPGLGDARQCVMEKCDIDCEVSAWSPWDQCSVTCASGQQTRARQITVPQKGIGLPCPPLADQRICTKVVCPVDCVVGDWTRWSSCSRSCDQGRRTRTRPITVQQVGNGLACPNLLETQHCLHEPCDVNCEVSNWSRWSACSQSCDSGLTARTRNVTTQQRDDGTPCPDLEEMKSCQLRPCDVNCEVSAWSPWSPCPVTCGNGTQIRTRLVTVDPVANGDECPVLESYQSCHPRLCDVNCEVSTWSPWSPCPVTCGSSTQIRTRLVTVDPVANGDECPVLVSYQSCTPRLCVLCKGLYEEGERLQQVALSTRPLASDVVFVVDETYSMAAEHIWLRGIAESLDDMLQLKGIGNDSSLPNRYALVGYGQRADRPLLLRPHHYRRSGSNSDFLTPGEFKSVAEEKLQNDPQGRVEDGYLAIHYALNQLSLRHSSQVAVQVILLSDEDRDIIRPDGENITRSALRHQLRQAGDYLNVIVDNSLFVDSSVALGGSRQVAYQDSTLPTPMKTTAEMTVGPGFGGTSHEYVRLALNEGGTSWDINYIQASGDAFTAAFLDAIVEQAVEFGNECQNCQCVDDGGSGTLSCTRNKHQARCKCDVQGKTKDTGCNYPKSSEPPTTDQ